MAMAPCGAALVFGLLAVSAAAGEESHIPAASVAAGQQAPVGQQADAPPGVCLLQTSPGLPRKSPTGSAAWGGRDRSHSLMDRNEAISDEVAGAKLDKGRMTEDPMEDDHPDWRTNMDDPEGKLWDDAHVEKVCTAGPTLCAKASVKMQGCQYVPDGYELPEDAKPKSDPDHWFELPLGNMIKPGEGKTLGKLFTTREPRKVDSSWPKFTPKVGEVPMYTLEDLLPKQDEQNAGMDFKLIAEGKIIREAFKKKVDEHKLHNVLALVEDGEDLAATSYHLWDFYQMLGLVVLRVPSPDFDVPSRGAFEQAIEFMSIAAWNGRNTLIHCWGGSGRTATFAIGLMKNFGVEHPITEARRVGKSVYLDVREQELFILQMQRVATSRMPKALETQLLALPPPGDVVEEQNTLWNPKTHFDRARIRLFQPAGLGGPGQWVEWGHAIGRQETCRKMFKKEECLGGRKDRTGSNPMGEWVNMKFAAQSEEACPPESDRAYGDNEDPWQCVEEADFWNQPKWYQAELDHSHIVEPTWERLLFQTPDQTQDLRSKLTDFTGDRLTWNGGHKGNEGALSNHLARKFEEAPQWSTKMKDPDPEGLLWDDTHVKKVCKVSQGKCFPGTDTEYWTKERQLIKCDPEGQVEVLEKASVKMQGCQYSAGGMPADALPDTELDHWYVLKLGKQIKPREGATLGMLFTTREPRKVDKSATPPDPAEPKEKTGDVMRKAFEEKVALHKLHNVLALVEDGEDKAAESYHLWDFYQKLGLVVLRVPSPDFDAPPRGAFQQAIEFMSIAAWNGRNTLIHCWGGTGRTGTFAIGLMKNFGVEHPITEARRVKSVYLDVREQELMISQMQRVITPRMPQALQTQLRALKTPGDVVENQKDVWNPKDHFDRARIRLFQQVGAGGPGQYAEWGHAVGRQETCRKMFKKRPLEVNQYSNDPDPWTCVEEADFWNQPESYQRDLDHSHIVEPTWDTLSSTNAWSPDFLTEKLTDFTGMRWEWTGGHKGKEGELSLERPKREVGGEEKLQYNKVMGMN